MAVAGLRNARGVVGALGGGGGRRRVTVVIIEVTGPVLTHRCLEDESYKQEGSLGIRSVFEIILVHRTGPLRLGATSTARRPAVNLWQYPNPFRTEIKCLPRLSR